MSSVDLDQDAAIKQQFDLGTLKLAYYHINKRFQNTTACS